jgi:CheY-like chemotaxis protein
VSDSRPARVDQRRGGTRADALDGSSPRVLIVDDDQDVRETLGMVLELHGFRPQLAAGGQEAIDRLERDPPPSLIVLDLMMPELSGSEVLERVQRDGRLAQVPVVVLSGDRSATETAARYKVGALLGKPVEASALVQTARRLAGGQRPLTRC